MAIIGESMRFLQNKGMLFSQTFFTILTFLIAIISTIFFTNNALLLIFTWAFFVFYFSYYFILRKTYFAKVVIDNEYIKIQYKDEILQELKWADVVKVLRARDGMLEQSLVFYNKDYKEILFAVNLSQKNKIIEICPREDLKEQLRNVKIY